MNINFELENHLMCEFKLHHASYVIPINETRGIVDGIDKVINCFTNMVLPQIKEVFNINKTTTVIYDETSDEWKFSNIKTFFTKFKLTLKIEHGKNNTYNGNTATNSVKTEGKTFICAPNITLNITATDIIKCGEIFNFCIGHELTHAYNLLQYALKNNTLPNDNIMVKNKYRKINQATNNIIDNNYAITGQILYKLSRIERNAYIAQLRQELIDRKKEIKDYKTLFEVVKTTESYKKFLNLEANMAVLNGYLSDKSKLQLVSYLNNIMDTEFTNFNQVKKYFNRRWNKWKKSYLSKAAKIAYDVYDQYNGWLTDDSNNDGILKLTKQ